MKVVTIIAGAIALAALVLGGFYVAVTNPDQAYFAAFAEWATGIGAWALDYPGEALVTSLFLLVAVWLGRRTHKFGRKRGRIGLWLFVNLVWSGLWLLFWLSDIHTQTPIPFALEHDFAYWIAGLGSLFNAITHWVGEAREEEPV